VTRGARALVLCPGIRVLRYDLDSAERLAEAEGLALAIGVVIAHSVVLPVRQMQPNTLFGSGQVENIGVWCEQYEAELVIVDGALSPIQQRNLEDKLKRKVIDRTGLILEIFGERAATAEGRLQVELAHLDYQQSRLVRSWTHLERQRAEGCVDAVRQERHVAQGADDHQRDTFRFVGELSNRHLQCERCDR